MSKAPSHDFFLARQPILDRNEQIVAYEMLFRSGHDNKAVVSDDALATSTVIVHAFTDLGIGAILGSARGFLNFSADLLMSDVVELLPKNQVVIELLETIEITDEIVARCKELKAQGFTLALDDFVRLEAEHEALMKYIDVVKMELPALTQEELAATVKQLKQWPVRLLAEKIDTPEQAEFCKSIGFDLFQGYYFSRPAILSGKKVDMAKLTLLQLLAAVIKGAEINELEQILKHDPGLTHSLLKLVNSAAMGLRYRIGSLKQALVTLGRQQLQRWLELMIYVHQTGSQVPSPLLILASTRGRFMESLAKIMAERGHQAARDFEDRAFLVGVMSLIDAVIAAPMEEIVEQLSLDDELTAALLERSGLLGTMRALTECIEQDDYVGVSKLLPKLPGVKLLDLPPAQLAAIEWATEVGKQSVAAPA
jgi:EAL and modified HD-GYP domain-containing signal transduction protein